jgi:hypothetical protein
MTIYDIETQAIERIEGVSRDQVAGFMEGAQKPLIFSGLDEDFAFLREWNLDFFSSIEAEVPVQKPESDGVNYFYKYFKLSLADFVERIRGGENLYLGARQILKDGGVTSNRDGLASLEPQFVVPPWVDRSRIYSANLWIGAGDNRTLLHYDPWDGVLMLGSGKKEFVLLPRSETSKVYPYGALDYKSLIQRKVLHSKIRPLDVQEKYQAKFSKAKGYRGTISAGEMIFIPAGFWHFVNSTEINIGVNFFIHFKDRRLLWQEPIRSYWIKDNITLAPIRWYYVLKRRTGRLIRLFYPNFRREKAPN